MENLQRYVQVNKEDVIRKKSSLLWDAGSERQRGLCDARSRKNLNKDQRK